jgi:pectinesterase inhibitor-like protein|uniref:Pectinesterase inhibitor domain-containing protein n=1 Tax=Fagus sylvatica TaxID=28930 RepID=A0A2N9IQB4_FAGSY
MEPNNNNQIPLLISLFSLIFFNYAQAVCVPRNSSTHLLQRSPPPNSPPKPSPSPDSAPTLSMDPSIKKICETTDNPDLCVSSIAPFLSGKTDPISVLEMAINAATQHAKNAMAMASKLSAVPKATTDSANAPLFEDCKEMYSDALDNLQSAMDAIPSRDIGTINSMLSAALTDFVTCEDGFSGETSPLSPYDDKGTKMASNCLAIASLIK